MSGSTTCGIYVQFNVNQLSTMTHQCTLYVILYMRSRVLRVSQCHLTRKSGNLHLRGCQIVNCLGFFCEKGKSLNLIINMVTSFCNYIKKTLPIVFDWGIKIRRVLFFSSIGSRLRKLMVKFYIHTYRHIYVTIADIEMSYIL